MNHYLRRALPLVGVAALVSSAMAAAGGAALAGKPDPVASAHPGPGVCEDHGLGYTNYRHYWDLSGNKGRWLYVQATLVVGKEVHQTNLSKEERFAKSGNQQVFGKVAGGPQTVTMSLQFYDRRGVEQGAPHEFILRTPECER